MRSPTEVEEGAIAIDGDDLLVRKLGKTFQLERIVVIVSAAAMPMQAASEVVLSMGESLQGCAPA
jgi:hypothetical protein